MPTVYLSSNPSISAYCPPLKPKQQEVSKAYFAKREEDAQYKTAIKDHTTKAGETLSKIAKKYNVDTKDVKRTKTTKYLQVGEIVKVTAKEKTGVKVKFTKLDKATVGEDVYIVIETLHLEEETVIVNVLQGQEDVLSKKDALVTVQQDNQDVTQIKTTVGNYCNQQHVTNKDEFVNWAIAKVKLQPKAEAKQNAWKDGLECAGEKKAFLYLLVDVHSENSIPNFKSQYILYKGYKGGKDDSNVPNHFLNEEGAWFEVTNIKWYNPVKNPQLRGHYSIWAPERSIHSKNIKGRSKGKHDGLDLYAPEGTPLYATVDGEIYDPYISGSYGNTLTIKGKYNNKTYYFFYAHLRDKVTYKSKDKVKAGDVIGYSGKTGKSAKNLKANQVHLHFEIRTEGTRTGNRVNPVSVVSELKRDLITNPKKEDQI